MARSVAIAGVLIRRCLRDPALVAMFVAIPIVGALVFGLADQRANDSLPVGIVSPKGSVLANGLVSQLRAAPELRLDGYDDRAALGDAVRRGDVYAGVVVPDDYDRKAEVGDTIRLSLIGDGSGAPFEAARTAVLLVADREQQTLAVARRLAQARDLPVAEAMPAARDALTATPATTERVTANKLTRATGLGRSVAGMLVFFVFATSMGYATLLVGDRRRGVLSRTATTRATDWEIIAGEIGGRFAISATQGLLILVLSALFLGVAWGDPFGAVAVVVSFSIVSSSLAVVIGCRLHGSQEQSVWLTDGLMAVLGVLGGCFFTLRLLPTWVREVGHVSPHAWAVDAFERLITTNAGIATIAPSLLVLIGIGALCFVVAVRQLRRSIGD